MPERSTSLDAQSINTAIHVDTGQEQNPPVHQQPKHQLRRKKGRLFDNGFLGALRKIGSYKSPSLSSDPEDAPNRPHIVPPLHDSSDPERSTLREQNDVEHGPEAVAKRRLSAFRRGEALLDPGSGLSLQDKLAETTELMRVRTAAAGVTLQRLEELDDELDGQERQGVLAIASAAANVASKEYARVRRTRPKTPLARMLARNAEVPFAEVHDYGEYLLCLRWQARELQDGVWGLGGFREASRGVEDVRKRLDEVDVVLERGGLAADMFEIQWLVERKCMFWAAVDILTADNTESDQDEIRND